MPAVRARRRPRTRGRRRRWSRQSVKPPVDAPASRARLPATSIVNRSSAPASLSPPRDTKRGGGPVSVIGSAGETWRAGVAAGAPATSTFPSRMAAAAPDRLPTSPRRTSSASSRRRMRRYEAPDGFSARAMPVTGALVASPSASACRWISHCARSQSGPSAIAPGYPGVIERTDRYRDRGLCGRASCRAAPANPFGDGPAPSEGAM